jgi:hypothetical protein
MRNYCVYLLKPEVAASFFGKESMIFQVFYEGETACIELREIVKKQINYISSTIPSLQIKKNLEKSYKTKVGQDFYMLEGHYYLNIKAFNSSVVLKDHGTMLTISASGTYQGETAIFEILRQINSCFFAVDFENRNYGWLNPVKQVNYS